MAPLEYGAVVEKKDMKEFDGLQNQRLLLYTQSDTKI
jgi:hypothetical protein